MIKRIFGLLVVSLLMFMMTPIVWAHHIGQAVTTPTVTPSVFSQLVPANQPVLADCRDVLESGNANILYITPKQSMPSAIKYSVMRAINPNGWVVKPFNFKEAGDREGVGKFCVGLSLD